MFTTLFFTSLAYRECCYHCHYANLNREGDITLGDLGGGGGENVMPVTAKQWNVKACHGVSLVMVNSDKGQNL